MFDSDELMAAYPLDILEYANSYAFVIDMPGLDPDDVRVQVKACNVLLISGEGRRVEVEGAKYIHMERRSMRKFVRKFALPMNANTGKITMVSMNDVLTVTVEKQPKPIMVKHEQLRSRGDERKIQGSYCDLPTSILCRRWRHLHNFTANLDFDGTKVSEKVNSEDFEKLREKFLRWVDGVVRLNRCSRLEKFRISCHLRESDAHRIDEWVRFAISRKVESMELVSLWGLEEEVEYYTLNWSYDFNFMKKLSTHRVKVSGEAVVMLLRNCPLLEQLSIAKSKELLCLEIIKPFPMFKSLEIVECWNLSSVMVYDSNIVSFKYCGYKVSNTVLMSVPLLTGIWINGMCTKDAEGVIEMFSSVLPQLRTLKICFLNTSGSFLCNFCSRFFPFVEMSNLKQLVVDIADIYDGQNLLPLINMQRFVIEEPYKEDRANDFVEVIPLEIPMASSADGMILKANTELKEVEFVGYRGMSRHFELLKYLVENAIALGTIVVDPQGFTRPTCSFDRVPRHIYDEEVFARANALKYLVLFHLE